MKVLILSCNTGEGHNSCAKALQKALLRQGIQCEVVDTLSLVSETISNRISDAYVFSTKGPIFEIAYKMGEFFSDNLTRSKSPIYQSNKLYAKRLYDYIVDNHFDAVVCVHLFPAEALTALHRKAKMSVPTFFVMTDYTSIPFLAETELDYYIIPHEHLIEEFVEKGLPREKIIPIGIPVDEAKFTTRLPQSEARQQMAQTMGWPMDDTNGHWYLIMSGSMGFGNLGDLVSELIQRIRPEDRIICVCGHNQKVYQSLRQEFEDQNQLRIIGFTDQVSALMDASDVIFTKPGGITSTETIVKGLPLVHTAPIPGLEEYNARFFHYHNLSYHTNDIAQQVSVAMRSAEDATYREKMLTAQRVHSNSHASDDVVGLIRNATNAS